MFIHLIYGRIWQDSMHLTYFLIKMIKNITALCIVPYHTDTSWLAITNARTLFGWLSQNTSGIKCFDGAKLDTFVRAGMMDVYGIKIIT